MVADWVVLRAGKTADWRVVPKAVHWAVHWAVSTAVVLAVPKAGRSVVRWVDRSAA